MPDDNTQGSALPPTKKTRTNLIPASMALLMLLAILQAPGTFGAATAPTELADQCTGYATRITTTSYEVPIGVVQILQDSTAIEAQEVTITGLLSTKDAAVGEIAPGLCIRAETINVFGAICTGSGSDGYTVGGASTTSYGTDGTPGGSLTIQLIDDVNTVAGPSLTVGPVGGLCTGRGGNGGNALATSRAEPNECIEQLLSQLFSSTQSSVALQAPALACVGEVPSCEEVLGLVNAESRVLIDPCSPQNPCSPVASCVPSCEELLSQNFMLQMQIDPCNPENPCNPAAACVPSCEELLGPSFLLLEVDPCNPDNPCKPVQSCVPTCDELVDTLLPNRQTNIDPCNPAVPTCEELVESIREFISAEDVDPCNPCTNTRECVPTCDELVTQNVLGQDPCHPCTAVDCLPTCSEIMLALVYTGACDTLDCVTDTSGIFAATTCVPPPDPCDYIPTAVTASAGDGGSAGALSVFTHGTIPSIPPASILLGTGGNGGSALALRAPTAQQGTAIGGNGGDSTAFLDGFEWSQAGAGWLASSQGGAGGSADVFPCNETTCWPPFDNQNFNLAGCALGVVSGTPGTPDEKTGLTNAGTPGMPGDDAQWSTQYHFPTGVDCNVSRPATSGEDGGDGSATGATAQGGLGGNGLLFGGRGGDGTAKSGEGGPGGLGGNGGRGGNGMGLCASSPCGVGGDGGNGGFSGSASGTGGTGGNGKWGTGGNGGNGIIERALGGKGGDGGPGGEYLGIGGPCRGGCGGDGGKTVDGSATEGGYGTGLIADGQPGERGESGPPAGTEAPDGANAGLADCPDAL